MKAEIIGNSIVVDSIYFDIADTLECGQVFRYTKVGDKAYQLFSTDQYAYIEQVGTVVTISCDNTAYWWNYFDLDSDYHTRCNALSDTSDIMKQASQCGKGIRILRQDKLETVISFIISANNNIVRIRGIIDRICTALGQATEHGYAFPTVEALASADVSVYVEAGAGYRAPYIVSTANMLLSGVPALDNISSAEANKQLQKLSGVGPKVADCILLFGYGIGNVVPVDTWIKKVYHSYYECGHRQCDIASYLVSLWGDNAGLAQQYLFHYERKHRQTNNNGVQ